MFKKKKTILLTFFSAILFFFISINLITNEINAGVEMANIGFASVTNYEEISQFLKENDVIPTSAYVYTSGLTGTYRTYVDKDIDEFLNQVKKNSISSFQKGLKSNVLRLELFLEQYSEEEVASSEELQKQLKSLLNIRSKLQHALKDAESGNPIIYALEVKSKKENLEQLKSKNLVQVLAFGVDRIKQKLKPKDYEEEVNLLGPEVRNLGGKELYQYVEKIVTGNK